MSIGFTDLVSLGFTWCRSVSLGLGVTSLGVTWCHSVTLGVIWCHSVTLRTHLVSLSFTRCHFRVTRFHLVSLGFTETRYSWILGSFPHDVGSLGGAQRVGRSIFFSVPRKKRPLGVTWIHFIAKKQVFQEVAETGDQAWELNLEQFRRSNPGPTKISCERRAQKIHGSRIDCT